jgi:hypothetical protein
MHSLLFTCCHHPALPCVLLQNLTGFQRFDVLDDASINKIRTDLWAFVHSEYVAGQGEGNVTCKSSELMVLSWIDTLTPLCRHQEQIRPHAFPAFLSDIHDNLAPNLRRVFRTSSYNSRSIQHKNDRPLSSTFARNLYRNIRYDFTGLQIDSKISEGWCSQGHCEE